MSPKDPRAPDASTAPESLAPEPEGWRSWLPIALIVAITAAVYSPVRGFDFVSYDDPAYVTENPAVRSGLNGDSLRWAFSAFHSSNWHPLTWVSHMLDVQLFGLEPGRHHQSSLFFHLLNIVLCWAVLRHLGLRTAVAALVTALFALHPLRVESVAWVAERKDVLSGTFFFLTLWLYAGHDTQKKRMGLVTLAFLAGLLAKPMLVSVPLVLLLIDLWPRGRAPRRPWSQLVLEKAPLFVLAFASAAVTLLAQGRGGAIQSFERLPLDVRIAHAPVAVFGYVQRFLWPVDLACYYPHPALTGASAPPPWTSTSILAAVGLIAISAFTLHSHKKRPVLTTGWWWMLFMLAPVIGIVQVGGQALADRYTYLPLLGLSLFVVVPLTTRLPERAVWIATAIIGATLAFLTQQQVRHWRDTPTLFAHALEVTGDNHVVSTNLGSSLAEAGRLEEARPHLERAIRLAPRDPRPRTSLGTLLLLTDDPVGARTAFEGALEAASDFAPAVRGLGAALSASGENEAAIRAFTHSLELTPADPEVCFELGRLHEEAGARGPALERYGQALREDPDFVEAALSYAWLIATTPSSTAERKSALDWANRANQLIGGRDADALDVLAAALAANSEFDAAVQVQRKALQLGGPEGRASREQWLARFERGQALAPASSGGGQ